jgi:hypothetical protein
MTSRPPHYFFRKKKSDNTSCAQISVNVVAEKTGSMFVLF